VSRQDVVAAVDGGVQGRMTITILKKMKSLRKIVLFWLS
jgi:hypothetical protein